MGQQQRLTPAQFDALHADMLAHASDAELFAQDLYGGADPANRIKARVYTELAWHSLFIRTLLIRPRTHRARAFVPELTILDLPSFKADPEAARRAQPRPSSRSTSPARSS